MPTISSRARRFVGLALVAITAAPSHATGAFLSLGFSMLDHSCQSRRRPLSERGLDLYETPTCATEALLRVEELPHGIWEPAAGHGGIAKPLRAHGHFVV